MAHNRGRITEENHYYAYGLKIAGISSKKLADVNEGHLKNQYQWQGDYSEFDDETGWNEFYLRDYDPQVGRFVQADPYDQFPSPYTGMGNDPVNNVDPSGGWAATGIFSGLSTGARIGVTTLGGAIIGGIVDGVTGGDGKGILIGAGIGLGSNFVGSVGAIGGVLKGAAPSIGVNVANVAINIATQHMSNQFSYARYLSNEYSKYDFVSTGGLASSDPPGFWKRLWRSYQKFDRWVGEHGGDWINENINPVTPFVEFVTGKQYKQGNFTTDKPRLQSATEAIIVLIPGGKLVGTGKKIFIKGVGNISKDYFHEQIKINILKSAGKFEHIVGRNPDIFVEGGKIVLKGVKDSFNGKTFKTSLEAADFFK